MPFELDGLAPLTESLREVADRQIGGAIRSIESAADVDRLTPDAFCSV